MNPNGGITRAILQRVAVVTTLAIGMGGPVLAADPIDDALHGAGKIWYERYCTPCHGTDGAPGEAVARDTKQPVDLRTYVQRHGGRFPAADWLAIVADARPGSVHAPVWESIRRSQVGTVQADVAARGVLGSIARYVRAIQTK